MSEFLVKMVVTFDPHMPTDERERLRVAEARQARRLTAEGTLIRLWRIPGRRANWGIWSAEDATALHRALTSLPLWPWLAVDVHPLAEHENDPANAAASGTVTTPLDAVEAE